LKAAGEPEHIDLFTADRSQMKLIRRDLQIVFQDPFSSLNPRLRVGTNVAEPLRAAGVGRQERRDRVAGLLADVGLRAELMRRFPHELSGGQRQRIAIARALALEPQFIVADEAVSALDVSIQAQVLNLFIELQQARGLAYLFVAHNLAVVRYVSHRIAVMYLGRIVELAETDALFARPRHPYTEALIASVPGGVGAQIVLPGEPPSPVAPPPGCPFHPRCPYAQPVCKTDRPPLRPVTTASAAACHFAETLALRGA
jgi:oligopeptide/dipeptide ABC transporter ATP-binding protein